MTIKTMPMFKYIPVPEVVWLFAIVVAKYAGGNNTNGHYNDFIENATMIIPALLLFIIWIIQKSGVGYVYYFNIRLILCSVVLRHFFFTSWASAYTPKGPGSGTLYIVGMMITIVLSVVYLLISYFKKI
ncbi:MAG: hypothetical protein ABIR66_03885 [Saprospiraceae bacterium]